jgi:NAD(P)-dependent dehydrogenase (short-subunit alcohol dehydrogenase family)
MYLTRIYNIKLQATRALAAEWAKANIRFNSIAPSTAETGMYLIFRRLEADEQDRDKLGHRRVERYT